MIDSVYQQLVTEAQNEVAGSPMSEWPIELLNEIAYDLVPEGDRVTILSEKRVFIEKGNELHQAAFEIGTIANSGFFRGYNPVSYNVEVNQWEKTQREILTIRLDDSEHNIGFFPLENITMIDVDTISILDVVTPDDEVLSDIEVAVGNSTLDFKALGDIFNKLDPNFITTRLYLDYLNKIFKMKDIIASVIVDAYIANSEDSCTLQRLKRPELTTPDKGRSFSYIGLCYEDRTETILCINVVDEQNTFARTRIDDINNIIFK